MKYGPSYPTMVPAEMMDFIYASQIYAFILI